MRYYEKIDGSKYRNILVVGDLHGCYTNLMKKLETIGFDTKKDLLISVGDLVDRGTENVECLELITFPWFRAVRGNHEQMMIDGLSERGNVNHWLLNGGGWFFNLDYDKEILAKALAHKADELPLIIELVSKDKKYVICHADYPCDEYEFGSAAYRAVTMLIPNLTQPTWSRTVKPLYDALVVQCHKEESIADNILNAVTR